MDTLEPPAYTEIPKLAHQQSGAVIKDSQPQLRDRRREKPLLSYNTQGIGLSCTYELGGPSKGKSKVSVGDRIQQLEELVRSLLAQQQSTPDFDPGGLIQEHSFQAKSPQSVSTVPRASLDEDTLVPPLNHASISQSNDSADSPVPSPSEPGSMRLNSHGIGASYVGSVHWAAVLDSTSELRDHYEEEEEARLLATNDHLFLQSSGPRLLYEQVQTTKADLLASIPARPVVDLMVARYFNTQGVVPSILHSGHFLREYDTAEPRNLLGSDFDENTIELPPSRPETEVTPVLYSLAKGRIDKVMGLVNDRVNDTKEHPYTEIMELDRKLQQAEASLPPILQWKPLSQSFMVASEIVMHRVLLQLAIQRLTIWLHRKYLAPPYTQPRYQCSRNA
ncbi:hypothetical protein LZL87_009256 [Fusarium oxysporum]|nr:hypothetical protein LZL87_009256 [Fusarium oxysporum]